MKNFILHVNNYKKSFLHKQLKRPWTDIWNYYCNPQIRNIYYWLVCFFFFPKRVRQNYMVQSCVCVCAYVCMLSHVQLFCDLMACSPPWSSVHGIVQARILEWVAISFSRGSSDSGTRSGSPTSQADSLPLSHLQSRWALRAAERKVDYSEESVRTISWSFGAKCKLAFQRSPAGKSKISV